MAHFLKKLLKELLQLLKAHFVGIKPIISESDIEEFCLGILVFRLRVNHHVRITIVIMPKQPMCDMTTK